MNTRTLVLIIVLGIVAVGLVTLAVMSQSQKQPATTTQQAPISVAPVKQTAVLYFERSQDQVPVVGTSSATPATPVKIMINAGENKIMGAQIELSYDPNVLSNVKVTPPTENSFFGPSSSYIVLDNTVKQAEGRLSYVIAMSPTSEPKVGIGNLGTISFSKKGTQSTTLTFLDKSNVQQLNTVASVLKEARAITIE